MGRLLHTLGYSLQALQKRREGTSHPDRNAQFEHINTTAAVFLDAGQPVISVDTKKKELVGDFRNAGREWQPTGTPEPVRVHDFPGDAVGKAIPYGVYDMARNEAWVSVGRYHDTPAFAVASIRQWWTMMGRRAYPQATAIYITADAGGSNGYRSRTWKHGADRDAQSATRSYMITKPGVNSCEGTFASSIPGLFLISSRVRETCTACCTQSIRDTDDGATATHFPPIQLLVSTTR